jgi:hypothetical protein
MIRTIYISALLCLSTAVSAQTNNTFFLGHSLINFNVPNMVNQLSIASTETFSYDANIGNGASLGWHWNNPTTGQGPQWDLTLPNGGYENFILTEAVPLVSQLDWGNTYRYTDSLCSYANQYNPNIQYYLYETWHCNLSGNGSTSGSGGTPCDGDPESTIPWRDRLTIDLDKWESIADSINLIHTNPMLIIPNGQALGRLADSIENGAVPGLTSFTDLFVDSYHLDNRGNYFVACVVYSVIHGVSPVGLPNQLETEFGNLYAVYPTTAQALIMQEIAWETVCDYPRDGVDCTLDISTIEDKKSAINIYPIPANDQLTIQYDALVGTVPFVVYNQLGKVMFRGDLTSPVSTIEVEGLANGVYFIVLENQTIKLTK